MMLSPTAVPLAPSQHINQQFGAQTPVTSSFPQAAEFWTTDETALFFRCMPQSIRKAVSQKGAFHGLKPRRFGRRWYFKAAEVRAMMEVT